MSKYKFIKQMDVTRTPVDVRRLGKNFVLTNMVPRVNRENEEVVGYEYEIVCIDYDFEKIKVVINGTEPMIPESSIASGHPRVTFEGLKATIYNVAGNVGLSIKADKINLVK